MFNASLSLERYQKLQDEIERQRGVLADIQELRDPSGFWASLEQWAGTNQAMGVAQMTEGTADLIRHTVAYVVKERLKIASPAASEFIGKYAIDLPNDIVDDLKDVIKSGDYSQFQDQSFLSVLKYAAQDKDFSTSLGALKDLDAAAYKEGNGQSIEALGAMAKSVAALVGDDELGVTASAAMDVKAIKDGLKTFNKENDFDVEAVAPGIEGQISERIAELESRQAQLAREFHRETGEHIPGSSIEQNALKAAENSRFKPQLDAIGSSISELNSNLN